MTGKNGDDTMTARQQQHLSHAATMTTSIQVPFLGCGVCTLFRMRGEARVRAR